MMESYDLAQQVLELERAADALQKAINIIKGKFSAEDARFYDKVRLATTKYSARAKGA